MKILTIISTWIGYLFIILIILGLLSYIIYKIRLIDKLEVLYHWYVKHEILIITPNKPMSGSSGIADVFGALFSIFTPEYTYSWRKRTSEDKKIIWKKD